MPAGFVRSERLPYTGSLSSLGYILQVLAYLASGELASSGQLPSLGPREQVHRPLILRISDRVVG